jgi:hypothetical protein
LGDLRLEGKKIIRDHDRMCENARSKCKAKGVPAQYVKAHGGCRRIVPVIIILCNR